MTTIINNSYLKNENFTIVLDSRNATTYYNSTYNSEVTFEMKYPILVPKDCLNMTWSVQAFTCPISWYLINSTNNLLSILMTEQIYDINIPYGNYNAISFQSIFLSNTTNNFIIRSTSTIFQIMGFLKNTSYTSVNQTLVLPFTCNFSGLTSINIICENIRTNNLDSRTELTSSSIIASVPINNSQGGVIYFQKYNDYCFDVKSDIIDYLDILIMDDLGNKINFNNQHWNLILQINFFREIIKPIDDTFNDIIAFAK